MQQIGAAHAATRAQRKQRRSNRGGRMDHRRNMGIVEVEHVAAGGVQKGGRQCIRPLPTPDDRRLACARELAQHLETDLDGAVPASAERGGKEIEERALRLMPHFRRNVADAGLDEKSGEPFADIVLVCQLIHPPFTGYLGPVISAHAPRSTASPAGRITVEPHNPASRGRVRQQDSASAPPDRGRE